MATPLINHELVAQIRMIETSTGRGDVFAGFIRRLEDNLADFAKKFAECIARGDTMAVERRLDVGPDFIEQALRLCELEPHDVGIAPPPEVERSIAGDGVLDDDRVRRAYGDARVVGGLHSLAHIAPGVVGTIVLDVEL